MCWHPETSETGMKLGTEETEIKSLLLLLLVIPILLHVVSAIGTGISLYYTTTAAAMLPL